MQRLFKGTDLKSVPGGFDYSRSGDRIYSVPVEALPVLT